MGSLIVGTGFVAGEVELEDLWLVGDTGAGNDYVIETKDSTWSINHVFVQGGDLGCVLLQGQLHRLSDMSLNLTDDIGMRVTGDNNQVTGIYIASPGGEAIHFTSAASNNLFSNIQVATAWNGAGTGPAILIDGDDNTVTQVRVRSNAGATYAIEIGATGDANTIGVVHLDTGATGIINDGGTNTVIYNDSTHAHTGGGDGAVIDGTGLSGVILADGTVDSTAVQRFTGAPVPIILGAAGDTQLDFEEQANGWALRVLDNADTAVDRIILNSGDHAQGHDINFMDGDGVTSRLRWDEASSVWIFSTNMTTRSILPVDDGIRDLGSAATSWSKIFVDQFFDGGGVFTYDILNKEFRGIHRFRNFDTIFGLAGGSQAKLVMSVNRWFFQSGSTADVFINRQVIYTADHATQAHDFQINNGAGTVELLWDNSASNWIFSSDVELDGDLNHDGTNVGFYGTAPTAQSAAYTPTNVTPDRAYDADSTGIDELADVLGTLIADLQLTGIVG